MKKPPTYSLNEKKQRHLRNKRVLKKNQIKWTREKGVTQVGFERDVIVKSASRNLKLHAQKKKKITLVSMQVHKKKKREKKRSMSVEKKGGMIELKVRFMRKENGNYEEVVEKERERREDS